MVALLITTTISCSDAVKIINRLSNVSGLTPIQKTEIVQEVRKTIPFCPVVIKKDTKWDYFQSSFCYYPHYLQVLLLGTSSGDPLTEVIFIIQDLTINSVYVIEVLTMKSVFQATTINQNIYEDGLR